MLYARNLTLTAKAFVTVYVPYIHFLPSRNVSYFSVSKYNKSIDMMCACHELCLMAMNVYT